MKKYYTGIGSRKTPGSIQLEMAAMATFLAEKGYILRSGGAEGADMSFEIGAMAYLKSEMEIYLPWRGFNGNLSPLFSPSAVAFQMAEVHHPAWQRLRRPARLLMARNTHQVMGHDCTTPSEFVICWTPNGDGSGGTGQALRIAKHYGIPIFDLGKPGELERVKEFIAKL